MLNTKKEKSVRSAKSFKSVVKSVESAKSLKSAILTSDAVKLGDVCEINPRRPVIKRNDDTETSFIPMAAVNDETGTLKRIEIKSYSEVKKGYTWFADNDVIFAKITPCMENGKQAIVRNLIDGFGFGSTEFHVLRASNIILPEWIHLYVRQQTVLDEAARHFTGAVGQQRVPQDFLANIKIPLPPITIQKEIADYLQFRLTCVEEAKQAVKAELEAVKSLKQAYLREVFSSEQSKDWGKVKLGDMCENLDSKRVPITSNVRNKGNIPYYGASGVVDYVEDYIFDEDLLLVSEDGANLISRTQPIAFSISGKTWINNHAHVLKFESRITQQFVEFYINYADINIFVSGSAQPKLNQENLNKIPIPLPPLAVQKEIADYLQTKFTTVDTLVQALTEKKKAIDDLPQAFLREVFGNTDGAG